MPEPFAQPRMRTCFSADGAFVRRPISGRVSVVMMARANCSKALASGLPRGHEFRHGGENFLDAQRRADHARGADENLRGRTAEMRCASLAAVATETQRRPSGPVQQFALPELTIMPRTFLRDSFMCAWQRAYRRG